MGDAGVDMIDSVGPGLIASTVRHRYFRDFHSERELGRPYEVWRLTVFLPKPSDHSWTKPFQRCSPIRRDSAGGSGNSGSWADLNAQEVRHGEPERSRHHIQFRTLRHPGLFGRSGPTIDDSSRPSHSGPACGQPKQPACSTGVCTTTSLVA